MYGIIYIDNGFNLVTVNTADGEKTEYDTVEEAQEMIDRINQTGTRLSYAYELRVMEIA